MDQEKSSQDLILPGPTLDPPLKHRSKPSNKKRGPMHFINVALFMIRSSRSDKSKGFSASKSKRLWAKLVDSVRPLRLQLQQVAETEAKRPLPPALTHRSPARTEFSEDSMFSPSAGSSRSATATPYASAVGLNEMAQSDDDETEAVGEGSGGATFRVLAPPLGEGDSDAEGDHMIDAKAEEFIANFYNEMMLQRRHSINERSLR